MNVAFSHYLLTFLQGDEFPLNTLASIGSNVLEWSPFMPPFKLSGLTAQFEEQNGGAVLTRFILQFTEVYLGVYNRTSTVRILPALFHLSLILCIVR
jgi:hypothetical protein